MATAGYLTLGLILGVVFSIVGRRSPRRFFAIALFIAALLYLVFVLLSKAPSRWVGIELLGILIYGSFGLAGLRGSSWWLVLGWAFHPIWDLGLHQFGPGRQFAPHWYTMLCLSFDLVVAGYLAYKEAFRPNPLYEMLVSRSKSFGNCSDST